MSTAGAFRTAVYIAGDREPKLEGFTTGETDVVIVDLEDGVAAERADIAREMLPSLIAKVQSLSISAVVRVNTPTGFAGVKDLREVAVLPFDVAVLIPKPVDAVILRYVEGVVGPRRVWCMGEEPHFATQIPALKSACNALDTVVIGLKDLADGLGIEFDLDEPILRSSANTIRSAAQAVGLSVIDGAAYGKSDQLERTVLRSRTDGFDGVSLIRASDAVLAKRVMPRG